MLYEFAALKHAFEADNVSSLVIQILRGKFEPVPTFYSSGARACVRLMFREHARARGCASVAVCSVCICFDAWCARHSLVRPL